MADAPRRTALIVDDDDDLSVALTRLLEREGWAVHRARTGSEGVAMAAGTASLDAALVDLVLPGVGGIEIVRGVRRAHPDCRIIGLTGLASPSATKAFLEAGADRFFAKPVDVRALLDALGARPA